MSSTLLAQALSDTSLRGTKRLLLLSLADGGGVVNIDSASRWCNMTREASERLIIQLLSDGWLTEIDGKIIHPALFLAAHNEALGVRSGRK